MGQLGSRIFYNILNLCSVHFLLNLHLLLSFHSGLEGYIDVVPPSTPLGPVDFGLEFWSRDMLQHWLKNKQFEMYLNALGGVDGTALAALISAGSVISHPHFILVSLGSHLSL